MSRLDEFFELVMTTLLVFSMILVIALPTMMIITSDVRVLQNKEHAYSAWVKLTGNPKQLTYEEWLTLPQSIKEQFK